MSSFNLFDTLSMQEDDEDIFMPTIDLNVNELNLNVNHLNLLSNDSGVIPSTSNQTVATAVSNARFATLSNQELNNIVTNADSRNTKANTKWAVNAFKEWCSYRNLPQVETMDTAQLDSSLARFYAEARKKDGTEYGRSALLSFRYSVERYLNNPPLNRGISINSDATFSKSNKMLNSVLRNLRRLGKEKVQHKAVITENDLKKLQESGVFNTQEPLGLLRATWFHVTLHFCRRGQEGQRELSPDSFTQETHDYGRKYYVMAHEEVTKNHQGGIQSDENYESDTRMYETDANGGFKYLMLYLSKINKDIPALFQYPKKNFLSNDTIWYNRKPLGVNKLSRMMKEISKAAGLSKVYTNHCLRATAITLLSEAKVPNRHIMAISGHRSEASLASYNNRPSQSQLYNCSNVIAAAASGKSKRLELVGSSGQQPEAFSHTHSINASVPFPQGFQGCNIGTINFVYNLPEQ